VLYCPGMFLALEGTKVHSRFWMWKLSNPKPQYVVYPPASSYCCRKHFLEYLLAEGKQIAEQTTLEGAQDIDGVRDEV